MNTKYQLISFKLCVKLDFIKKKTEKKEKLYFGKRKFSWQDLILFVV